MTFSEDQVKALSGKLSQKHVKTRQADGALLSYIEGWHAIAEANRIFGFDAWDRQTMTIKCVWEGSEKGRATCSYIARVRVTVRAGGTVICREGCGSGHGTGDHPGEAHENAIKAAETDAMKRALTTFGNPFGLALYDRTQQGVRGKPRREAREKRGNRELPGHARKISWLVFSAEGEFISLHENPVDYCKTVRQVLEASSTKERLIAFWSRNSISIKMLHRNLPSLKSEKGEHYADLLASIYQRLLGEHSSEEKTPPAKNGDRKVDKSVLALPAPKRIRNKAHLDFVSSQPCLVCARRPSQAHHLRFTQPRSLGRKVSDQWTVPLCRLHHGALHKAGDERRWWHEYRIDPLPHAESLWCETLGEKLNSPSDDAPMKAAD